jgi:hypothetical protein
MKMLAEVISSAFASGFSWGAEAGGKRTHCPQLDLKGDRIMAAFEAFLGKHPEMAYDPYGATMAEALGQAFPCRRP